jgi:hypothetical protein
VLCHRMMTGRPDRAERPLAVAAFQRVDRLEATAGRKQRRLPRCRRGAGVGVETAAPARAELLEVVEILRSVHSLELGSARAAGLEHAAGVARRAGFDAIEDSPHSRRPFGVTATGVVILEMAVGRDQEHPTRLTNRRAGRPRDRSRRYARRR